MCILKHRMSRFQSHCLWFERWEVIEFGEKIEIKVKQWRLDTVFTYRITRTDDLCSAIITIKLKVVSWLMIGCRELNFGHMVYLNCYFDCITHACCCLQINLHYLEEIKLHTCIRMFYTFIRTTKLWDAKKLFTGYQFRARIMFNGIVLVYRVVKKIVPV